jgi:hypothetical protein
LMSFRSDYCGVAALCFGFDHHGLIETLTWALDLIVVKSQLWALGLIIMDWLNLDLSFRSDCSEISALSFRFDHHGLIETLIWALDLIVLKSQLLALGLIIMDWIETLPSHGNGENWTRVHFCFQKLQSGLWPFMTGENFCSFETFRSWLVWDFWLDMEQPSSTMWPRTHQCTIHRKPIIHNTVVNELTTLINNWVPQSIANPLSTTQLWMNWQL